VDKLDIILLMSVSLAGGQAFIQELWTRPIGPKMIDDAGIDCGWRRWQVKVDNIRERLPKLVWI
jgi:pentose-5-phosphate-3-epimerase